MIKVSECKNKIMAKKEKFTEKEISLLFIESLEEAKKTAQKNEELEKRLNETLNDFILKLNKTELSVDDKKAKETIDFFVRTHQNAKKAVNLTRFAYGLIATSVFVLGISFYFNYLQIKTKSEIREEYKQELIEKEQYNNEQDAEFLKKFKHWISKNPNDSKSLNNSIQKEWERK